MYIYIFIHKYIHTYINTYIYHVHINTYIILYIHTYIYSRCVNAQSSSGKEIERGAISQQFTLWREWDKIRRDEVTSQSCQRLVETPLPMCVFTKLTRMCMYTNEQNMGTYTNICVRTQMKRKNRQYSYVCACVQKDI